jgi:hypothetical protein
VWRQGLQLAGCAGKRKIHVHLSDGTSNIAVNEESSLNNIGDFGPKELASTLHSMAKTRYNPTNRLHEALEGRAGARGGIDEGAGGAGGSAGGHVKRAESVQHAVGVCDNEAGARGGIDEGAGGAGGGAGGLVQRAVCGQHAVGVCEDRAGVARGVLVSSNSSSAIMRWRS